MSRFTGKKILITGATSGIGLAGATRIHDEGGHVIVTGINPQRLHEVEQKLPTARVLSNDASDPAAASRLAEEVADAGGGLDGAWLNAGYADVADVDQVTAELFDQMMAVNVRAPFLQLAALADHLNDGAAVVITSSTAAYEGSPMAAVYAATKGALVAAARGWATGLASRGVRVNVLVPGAIDTGFRGFMDDETRQSFETDVTGRVPLGRVGTADDVALFLLSDDASYVTGSQYAVDGGLTKR